MSTSSQGTVQIHVRARDSATEITVIDGQRRVAAQGFGRVSEHLTPGIYKVRAVTGSQTWEDLVVAPPGGGPIRVDVPPLRFATPVPLPNTAMTHEPHMAAAYEQSHRVHAVAGQGSAIFFFVRRYAPAGRDAQSVYPGHHPALGLSLWSVAVELVADLASA